MHYETRVCCFIDILGFRNHISKTVFDSGTEVEEKTNAIREILHLSRKMTGDTEVLQSKIVTYFSDSIVISYRYDETGALFNVLLNLQHVTMELANNGFLVRGGISIGMLCHDQDYVFGPALVAAYDMESKMANYPRIIIGKDVIEAGLQPETAFNGPAGERTYINEILSIDEDDMYYIDFISKVSGEFDTEFSEAAYLKNLQALYFKDFKLEPRKTKVKLIWLRKKINNHIRHIKSRLKTHSFPKDIAKVYSGLVQIK